MLVRFVALLGLDERTSDWFDEDERRGFPFFSAFDSVAAMESVRARMLRVLLYLIKRPVRSSTFCGHQQQTPCEVCTPSVRNNASRTERWLRLYRLPT